MTENDPNENFEQPNDPEIDDQSISSGSQRHSCVTAWLIFMLIANSITALIYLFTLVRTGGGGLKVSTNSLIALLIIGLFNVAFSIMLLLWKKIGFYGFAISSVITFIINFSIGISLIKCTIGLIGFLILYGILQIKRDGISAWDNLR